MANRYAGAGSPLALQNMLYLGEAQLASGDSIHAGETLTAAHDAALSQYGAAHPLTLRSGLGLALFTAAAGDSDKAQAQLLDIVAGMRKLPAQSETNLAQALEVVGIVQSSKGEIPQADVSLREAVALREKSPDDLWELAQARERLAENLVKSGSDAAPALLKKAARDLESELGADHPETLRARSALAHLAV